MATAKLPEKVLMVDDEANILDSFRRELRGKINLDTALGGEEGLRKLSQNGPYAVVVSDLRMPGMDGIEFLAKVRAAWPDTVRIMLTGYADVQNTISAVNEGHIFRFLTKPCDSVTLVKALAAGIRQYRLVTAEKELLEKTLKGSIAVLTDLLALVKPEAFARASRITQWVMQIVRELGEERTWEFEAAAMLSQIGFVTLPDNLIKKVCQGQELDREEEEMFAQHFRLAAELVARIPRLEEVSRIIAYQEKRFDGQGPPEDQVAAEDIPLGARVLKVVLDFDSLLSGGYSKGRALEVLKARRGWYDPAILTLLDQVLGVEARYDVKEVGLLGLEEGMVLAADVVSRREGKRLLAKGQRLSRTLIMGLLNYQRMGGVQEPIRVLVPLGQG